ncbi:MAG: Fic family protein [Nanoarchaeota archaeon]|nr:Fic family protein [Nanoarchaeota archaeon]
MVFVRKKKISGREYHYLVAKTRVDGKEKRIERYLGIHPPSANDLIKYAKEFDKVKLFLKSKKDLLARLSFEYRQKMKASKDEIKVYEEELITRFTYNTSRIEGSSLTFADTRMLLQEHITPGNRPLRDVQETENHKKAFLLLKTHQQITRKLIMDLHKTLKAGVSDDAGIFRTAQVTVANLVPVRADLIEQEIKNLILWNKKNQKMHTIERVCTFHALFERIHPFFDGNGRVGRLLLNFMLMQEGYPPVIIQNKNRRRYYAALRKADGGNILPLMKYIVSEIEAGM